MIVCCPVGKAKSARLCRAFSEGCPPQADGTIWAGVKDDNLAAFNAKKGDWYYIDNAWFDAARATHQRVAKNALQAVRWDVQDHARLHALGIEVKPWRNNGRHVLLVEQSPLHMRIFGGHDARLGNWGDVTAARIKEYTDRPVIIRRWDANKIAAAAGFVQALRDCWCVVTWNSAAACEAMLRGVPAISLGYSMADPMGIMGSIDQVEDPWRPEGREVWAAALAAAQWTDQEIRDGMAWRYWNP